MTDLHQKYGLRPRKLLVEPPSASAPGVASVSVVFGEREDAIAFTFTRIDGAWKLSSIGSADPEAVDPPAK